MQKKRCEMPFMVPEGFFEDMQSTVFSRLATDFDQAGKSIRRTLITKLMYAAACAVLCVVMLVSLAACAGDQDMGRRTFLTVDEAYSQLSETDQEIVLESYEQDILFNL